MKRWIKYPSIAFVLLLVSLFALLFFSQKPVLLRQSSFSRVFWDRQGQLLRIGLSSDDKYRLYAPLKTLNADFIALSLMQEDRHYWQHRGINPISMLKAAWQTYVLRQHRRGASTISMQVAKLRFHIASRSPLGKIQQIFRALQLERHYSKAAILEAYFNLAPYGGNIEGIYAASLIYFNKKPAELSLPEAMSLVILPQNPKLTQGRLRKQQLKKQYAAWLKTHPEARIWQAQIASPPKLRSISELPYKAAHFVNQLAEQTHTAALEIKSSLDLRLQNRLQEISLRYLSHQKKFGIQNLALLLVDSRDREVRVMIGSADFFAPRIQGQINGSNIKRSPGSTLKPFIYGLALDQGLILPNTLLADVPKSFGAYNPENFDYQFLGPIRAKDALVLSRNIPAVYLSRQLGKKNAFHLHSTTPSLSLYDLLNQAQIQDLKPESYYGLALGLGAVELSMQELVGLYTMLLNQGSWGPLRFGPDSPVETEKKLLSPEASFLVLDMLKETARPGYANMDPSEYPFPVAFKTGTSSGYRDAWTIGCFGPYVLGVWFGNFDNQSNPALIGKSMATPLFFEIVQALARMEPKLMQAAAFSPPAGLKQVALCKVSGQLPNPQCPERELGWFIPGKSPILQDTIHREVAIDPKTGLRSCHIQADTQFQLYEFWPSELERIFAQAGIPKRRPPNFEAGCDFSETRSLGPSIRSPQAELHYIVSAANAEKFLNIPLQANTDAEVKTVYWFANQQFIGKSPADALLLWQAKPGEYQLRLVDDHGQSALRRIVVELAG